MTNKRQTEDGKSVSEQPMCTICGADREWVCECGAHHDRDVNAAINLVTKCFGPGVDGHWTLRVKRNEAPDEASTTFVGRSKRDDLLNLAI